MLLGRERTWVNDPKLTLTTANFPAQTIKISLPRVAPLAKEKIRVVVTFIMKSAVTSGIIGHGFLNVLKRIILGGVPGVDGKNTNLVDVSGPGLLHMNLGEGLNMDRGTMATIAANAVPNMVVNGVYRLVYTISCPHPRLTDGLRPRCMLPIYTYRQDPTLELQFAAASEMSGTADPFTSIFVEVNSVETEMDDASIASLNATGGFFPWDIIETLNALPSGITNTEQKIIVPTQKCSYTGIQIIQMVGGATQYLADMSGFGANFAGGVAANPIVAAPCNAGAESEWKLKGAGKNTLQAFRLKQLQIENDEMRAGLSQRFARPIATPTAVTGEASPAWGLLQTGNAVIDPSSVHLDFIGAGQGPLDLRDLGSVFDVKSYADNNLEVAFYANLTTNVAALTYSPFIQLIGRRLFGDLSNFQKL